MTSGGRLGRVALGLALIAAAYGIYRERRAWIQRFFLAAPGGAPPPTLAGGPDAPGYADPPVDRVRVLLIDGVDRATATTMPRWSALCDGGLDLVVDSGFPTVSLPVELVLWTGLTQQQTGVLFRNGPLPPRPDAIPAAVPGSIAVAESHQQIVHSLGFATVLPADRRVVPDDWDPEAGWRAWLDLGHADGFVRAARDAVTSDARLAFVHVLRTDSIAHRVGRDSSAFRGAAAWADRLLGDLVDAERAAHPTGTTRWLVLADHGHRAGGGHGDAEPWIRQVRACVAGGLELPASRPRPAGYLHMVDVARLLADSLAVALPPAAAGRPLAAALGAPVDRAATLPRPGAARWLAALLLLLLGAAATGVAARRQLIALPWWWPIAYLSLIWIELPPSMTTHMVYQRWGQIVWKAALPGLCLLAIAAPLALRRLPPWRVAVAQLALPAAIALAGMVLSGGADLGLTGEPPLIPLWTGRTSAFLVLAASGAVVAGLAVLASAARGRSG